MLEIGTSGTVRGEDGNILTYSAYGILGGMMETAASFEVRNAPSSYPTAGGGEQSPSLPRTGLEHEIGELHEVLRRDGEVDVRAANSADVSPVLWTESSGVRNRVISLLNSRTSSTS